MLAYNNDPDPRIVYANRAAQGCFGYSWLEFTALPSRLSAEAPEQAERQELLGAVARDGFATDYQGSRTARPAGASGSRMGSSGG